MKKTTLFILLYCYFASICIALSQNLPVVRYEGTKCALADAITFKPLGAYKYDNIEPFQEGLALATASDTQGKHLYTFLNVKGQEILPLTPNQLFPFVASKAIFREKEKFGFLDKLGRVVVPAQYIQTANYSEGLAMVQDEKKQTFFLDEAGEVVFQVPEKYTFVDSKFSDGLIRVAEHLSDDVVYTFNSSYKTSQKLGKYTYLDKTGKEFLRVESINPLIIHSSNFEHGVALVRAKADTSDKNSYNAKYGIINKKGEMIIPALYKQIEKTEMGMFKVAKDIDNKEYYRYGLLYGLFDATGKEILPCVYKEIHEAFGSYCVVSDYKIKMPSRDKREEEEPKFSQTEIEKELYGIIDLKGNIVIKPQFESIWLTNKGFIALDTLETIDSLKHYKVYDFAGKVQGKGAKLTRFDSYQENDNQTEQRENEISLMRFGKQWALYNQSNRSIITDWQDEIAPFLHTQPQAPIAMRKGKQWHLLNQTFDDASNFGNEAFAPVKKNKHWALLHQVGKETTPYQYDSIIPLVTRLEGIDNSADTNWDYPEIREKRLEVLEWQTLLRNEEKLRTWYLPARHFLACQHKKWGVIDGFGKVLAPFENDSIIDVFYNYLIVKKSDNMGVIDYAGKAIVPFQFQKIDIINDLAFIKEKGKMKLYSLDGKQLLTPNGYDTIYPPNHEQAMLIFDNGKKGILSTEGEEKLAPIYDIIDVSSGRRRRRYRDDEGNFLYITLQKEGKKGIADGNYKMILPCEYDDIDHEKYNGAWLVTKDNKQGLYDRKGNPILPTQYEVLEPYKKQSVYDRPRNNSSKTLSIAKMNGKWGLIDTVGKAIIPLQYEVLLVHQNQFIATRNTSYFVLDTTGKILYTKKFEAIASLLQEEKAKEEPKEERDTEENRVKLKTLVAVKNKGKWGFITLAGEQVVPFRYEEVKPFTTMRGGWQCAVVKKGKYWGIIAKDGEIIVPFIYDEIENLSDNHVGSIQVVEKGQKTEIYLKKE